MSTWHAASEQLLSRRAESLLFSSFFTHFQPRLLNRVKIKNNRWLQHASQQGHKWARLLAVNASWAWFPPSGDAVERANKGWTRASVTWLGFCVQYPVGWKRSQTLQQHQRPYLSYYQIYLSKHLSFTLHQNELDGIFFPPWTKSGLCCPTRSAQTTSKSYETTNGRGKTAEMWNSIDWESSKSVAAKEKLKAAFRNSNSTQSSRVQSTQM